MRLSRRAFLVGMVGAGVASTGVAHGRERYGLAGTVLTGKELMSLEKHVVVVADGKIEGIVPEGGSHGIEVVRIPGATIMPGVINCHVHRVHSAEDRRERFLRHGVTSIGDAASPLAALSALKQSPAGTTATASFTGPMLCPPGGYPLPVHSPDHGLVIHSPAQGREEVRRLADLGVSAIKAAFEPGPYAEPWLLFDASAASAICDEARKLGLIVRCHVEDFGGLKPALDAGVHTVEHIPHRWIQEGKPQAILDGDVPIRSYRQQLERMVRDGVILTPTLDVLSRSIWNGPELYEPVRYFHNLGGRIAVGNDHPYRRTDAGMPMQEFSLLRKAGLDNHAILRSATVGSGAACSFKDRGWLDKGMAADMLVIDGNPVEDLSLLSTPARIVKDGIFIS